MLNSLQIARVSVIGAGTLGAQIAAMAAASGRTVLLYDALEGAADVAIDRLRSLLIPVIAAGDLDWELDAVLGRIQPVATLAESVAAADLVIEAVREEPETKRSVFRQIGEINPHVLLATNSSSIASPQLADAVADPGKSVNLHFFSIFWYPSPFP
ncbi:MAG: 3-hydroxyacyl-CoA dehydrogenase NAD-binding domain-containing protein, partial [Thermomicrobiales bacterium]